MSTSKEKTVLVLGAGLCSPPLIHYLADHGFKVIVGNRTVSHAQAIIDRCRTKQNCRAVELDIEKEEGRKLLEQLTPSVDAVVSMLPYTFHPIAAKLAIANKKHFFTTSYVSEAMKQLDHLAKEAGVVIVNECGVDPGTDHMSAMRVINEVRKKGGDIVSFKSFCGGLPAPEDNNNPFGYKLSWAPRGVLLASRNDATYLENGKDVFIAGKDLFDNYTVVDLGSVGKYEAYPNRNSKQYIDIYNIKNVHTMLRGTYRNIGWCPTIKKLADLGYLSIEEQPLGGKSYGDLMRARVNTSEKGEGLKKKVAEFLHLEVSDKIIYRMEWLDLFDENKMVAASVKTYLDALCELCKEKLVYNKGERDMILMRHEFVAEYPDRREFLSSMLVDFGVKNGESSMSRTVALPVAIAVRLVLEGHITLTGIQMPIIPELYNPILNELETYNIKFIDRLERTETK